MRIFTLTLATLLAVAPGARAALLFSDSFQGTLSQWETVGNGIIVSDPLNAGSKALAFSHLASGGDLYSPVISGTGAGTYTIGFDYLGKCGFTSQCGGFLGVQQTSGGEHWLASDTPYGGLADLYADTGAWQWVTFTFTATSSFALKLEDFSGSSHAYAYTAEGGASAYYANIEVYSGSVALSDPMGASAVPEPGTVALLGVGIAGLGRLRRRC